MDFKSKVYQKRNNWSSLVMKLSQHNNYEILDLMNAISTITNIPFEKVCHTGISTWWNNIIIEKLSTGECRFPTSKLEKKAYKGGLVIEPAIGYYNNQDVYVLDVKSLYPTMMINNNISFDTVNCPCCPFSQVPEVVVLPLCNNQDHCLLCQILFQNSMFLL